MLIIFFVTDGNKNNVIADIETVEDNINPVNEIFIDENLMKFVFHSIEKLEVQPKDFMEFEVFLKSFFQSYSLKYSPFAQSENYVKAIEILFESDHTILIIQNKMEETFLLYTQDVITQDTIVVFVPENEYLSKFMIKGGSCIFNDKMNTFERNDNETTENEFDNRNINFIW